MKIKSIKKVTVADTPMYDVINVPKNHNFIIGDNKHNINFISHNCAIDEMSFGDNDNTEYMQTGMMAIYNQLYLRLSSRFMSAGRIQGRMYLVSSAKSTNAVLESFIRDNEGQPGMHVSRYKQWEVLPASKFSGKWFKLAVGNELLSSFIVGTEYTEDYIKELEEQGYDVIDVPLETKHRFEMDLNRTLIDTCGISVQSSYKYIPYRIVEPCIGNGLNPFKQEIIKTGLKDDLQINDFFIPELVPEILYTKKLYVHCDLSKSGDMTGISCVAVLGYKNQERYDASGEQNLLKEMVFRHVFSVGLQCPANDELSMIKVKDFIHYLKYDLGWNIAGVSCDGYQSLMLLQSLQLDGFVTKEVSMDIIKNKEDIGYTTFRNVLVEQRIKLIRLHELLREITNLEKNNTTGKVDHPKQCLIGSTKIRLLDGTSKTIKELIYDHNNNIPNWVYTFNETTQKIEPKLIKNVWQTGYRKDLYKITLDNGKSVICTSNHPFMLRNGTYLEAEKLQVGQSLMPLYTKISNKGLKGYRMYFEPMECKWHYEHTMFNLDRQNNYTNYMNKFRWYTNGINDIYISDDTQIPEGYYSGRTIVKRNHKISKIEKLNTYERVYDLEIEDNHNFALDAGIFVHNSIKILDDGTKVKSVGKDISDSLGGAVYNAVLSVDINELDYMDGVTIADSNVSLTSSTNLADQYFGVQTNPMGGVTMNNAKPVDIEDAINQDIEKELANNQAFIHKVRKENPNTKLTDQQLREMYEDFNNDGFVIF